MTKTNKLRHIKEKNKCVYCGKPVVTFSGHWKLVSMEHYKTDQKNNIQVDLCFAHLDCYLNRYKKIISVGVFPMTKACPQTRTVNQVIKLLKIHGDIKDVKEAIKFLQRVVETYKKTKAR